MPPPRTWPQQVPGGLWNTINLLAAVVPPQTLLEELAVLHRPKLIAGSECTS